ncbi:MAG TPA: hypothetical protein VE152_12200, partial [Acidimicrobiales bacterium]|nr:hypothetical protein [Acidimicrobiales bacterium]
SLPMLLVPRMERRVVGSIYGSSRPERDFRLILELYRRGRLPLDKLISSRFSLDTLGAAVDQLRQGGGLRPIVYMDPVDMERSYL